MAKRKEVISITTIDGKFRRIDYSLPLHARAAFEFAAGGYISREAWQASNQYELCDECEEVYSTRKGEIRCSCHSHETVTAPDVCLVCLEKFDIHGRCGCELGFRDTGSERGTIPELNVLGSDEYSKNDINEDDGADNFEASFEDLSFEEPPQKVVAKESQEEVVPVPVAAPVPVPAPAPSKLAKCVSAVKEVIQKKPFVRPFDPANMEDHRTLQQMALF